MKTKMTFVTLVVACIPLAAPAQEKGGGSACRADAQRFCAQSSGREKIVDCLIDHQQDISDECYDFLKARLNQQRGGGANACKEDVAQYCKGVEPGGGRIVNCLIDHQKDISDGCYDFLKKQKSGVSTDGGANASSQPPEPARPIYRSQQADGRTIYSDVPQIDSTTQTQVPVVRQ